jgi:hypothetical protein
MTKWVGPRLNQLTRSLKVITGRRERNIVAESFEFLRIMCINKLVQSWSCVA